MDMRLGSYVGIPGCLLHAIVNVTVKEKQREVTQKKRRPGVDRGLWGLRCSSRPGRASGAGRCWVLRGAATDWLSPDSVQVAALADTLTGYFWLPEM